MTRPGERQPIDTATWIVGTSPAAVAAAAGWWWWRGARLADDDGPPEVLEADQVRALYDRQAAAYDVAAAVHELGGVRRIRTRAIDLLAPAPGDTVVDLGCGTGVNLPALARAAVTTAVSSAWTCLPACSNEPDIASNQGGFHRVELVCVDLRDWSLPADTDAVVSTFALEMVPDYDDVIEQIATTLDHGRIAVCGVRSPDNWPRWAIRLSIALTAPFGVNAAYESMRPRQALRRHTNEIHHETSLLGAIYLSVGQTSTGPRTHDRRSHQQPIRSSRAVSGSGNPGGCCCTTARACRASARAR